jgi:tetratricopeptide (TPR) repeat protein
MIRLVVTLLALFFPATTVAQTVPVRSGKHAEFTRLVLDMPRRVAWRVEKRETGASLIFDAPETLPRLDFDVDAVFERIGRERVGAVSSSPGRLEIDFACACDMSVFWHGTRMLVLDIAPIPQTASAESVPRPSARPVIVPARLRSAALGSLADRLDVMTDTTATQEAGDPPGPTAMRADLSAMRGALIEQLGRAASQGLLTPARRDIAEPETDMAGGDSRAPVDKADPVSPGNAPPAAVNLRAHSSVDRAIGGAARPPVVAVQAHTCPETDWVNVAAWGGTGPFHEELGRLNRGLLGEFDRPNDGVALELARFYLHHGFGAEARLALTLRGQADAQGDLLRQMSFIVDREAAGDRSGLANMLACDAPAMLWAMLAVPDVPKDITLDHKGLLRAFALLPDGLRRSLGPPLARRLLSAGHRETSQSILRVIDRHQETDDPETALARAELARALQEPELELSALRVAVHGNATASAEAVLALVEAALEKGEPVPLDRAELAGAYAQEYRGTALGHRMTRAYIGALAHAGAYEDAVRELERLRADIDPARTDQATADMLIGQMTRHADDVTFLRHVLSGRLGGPADVDPAIGREIADRLLATGFADRAAGFVAPDLAGHEAPSSRRLRAEIALAKGHPRAAEAELPGLDGPEADRLRARARSLAGDHAAAARLYALTGQPEAAERAAFLAADPAPMAGAEDPILRDVAELLRQPDAAEAAAEDPPLARHRLALDAAATARQVLARLLAETPGPDIPVN